VHLVGKLLADRCKAFVFYELLSNSWDEASTRVDAELRREAAGPRVRVVVSDDNPEGFVDLAHAYTVFGESPKKGDPKKRGRFDFGEKEVLALCDSAVIVTTKGTVDFRRDGSRVVRKDKKREAGSEFVGWMRMSRDEQSDVERAVRRVIPPVPTFFNGEEIPRRTPVRSIDVYLPTVTADGAGHLRRVNRLTTVELYPVLAGESAMIYEMGIPVVETGDAWHYNVTQKVPLNMNRDNVTPAYLRTLRTVVLNAMHEFITTEDANAPWARDAMRDEDVSRAAVRSVAEKRFGEKRVVFDPSDQEANQRAAAAGFTVVHAAQLSAAEWRNIRAAEAMLPAGRVTPSPKPFSPEGDPLKVIAPEEWTPAMRRFERAMVWQRRWPAAEVARLFAAHPLLQHLVRRLVWGVSVTDSTTFVLAAAVVLLVAVAAAVVPAGRIARMNPVRALRTP